MSVTLLGAPDTGSPPRVDGAVDPIVTITVQFTLVGDELPPAASRLISDLEALAGPESRVALAAASSATQSSATQSSSTPSSATPSSVSQSSVPPPTVSLSAVSPSL